MYQTRLNEETNMFFYFFYLTIQEIVISPDICEKCPLRYVRMEN